MRYRNGPNRGWELIRKREEVVNQNSNPANLEK